MSTKPKDPTAAARQRRLRENRKRKGLARVEEMVPASRVEELREIARKMREEQTNGEEK
jgi:hypothetical protein